MIGVFWACKVNTNLRLLKKTSLLISLQLNSSGGLWPPQHQGPQLASSGGLWPPQHQGPAGRWLADASVPYSIFQPLPPSYCDSYGNAGRYGSFFHKTFFILNYCCPVKLIMWSKMGWKPNNHIAQGNALGKHYTTHLHSPCKGKSLIIKLLPLQGALINIYTQYPGRCPGLCGCWAFSPHSI